MLLRFQDGYCYFDVHSFCKISKLRIDSKISIKDIDEDSEQPRVTFASLYVIDINVCEYDCRDCNFSDNCNVLKQRKKYEDTVIPIKFGFEFAKSDYDKYADVVILAQKEKQLQERERVIDSILKSLEILLLAKVQRLQEEEKKDKLDGDDDS